MVSFSTPQHNLGRFAPSATGLLHMGSLITALACALEASTSGGNWLLRIDDLDRNRCSQASSLAIEKTIQRFFVAFPPLYCYRQSDHLPIYHQALDTLIQQSLVYRCCCSRKDIARWHSHTQHQCRNTPVCPSVKAVHLQQTHNPLSTYRFKSPILLQDAHDQINNDLVLLRKEQEYSYHFACVINDQQDGITHIIRGADLIDAQIPQTKLIAALGYQQPRYSYIPLVRNAQGQKLSKQTHAPAIQTQAVKSTLLEALQYLQWPNSALKMASTLPHRASTQALWRWACDHWDLSLNLASIN